MYFTVTSQTHSQVGGVLKLKPPCFFFAKNFKVSLITKLDILGTISLCEANTTKSNESHFVLSAL